MAAGQYSQSLWQSVGQDTNSTFTNPNLNSNGTLPSVSPARNLAPSQTFFSDDFNHAAREQAHGMPGHLNFRSDTTAPTPNPMTFASNRAAVDAFSVTMTASTATDAGGTVSYFFEETTGAAGGTDSGWQTTATYLDSGLSPNTLYTYRVKARDPSLNETTYSSAVNVTTPATAGGTPAPTPIEEGMWNVSGTVIKTPSGFRIDLFIED